MENQNLVAQATGMDTSKFALNRVDLVLICSKEDDLRNIEGALDRYGFAVEYTADISFVDDIVSLARIDVIIVDGHFLYSDKSSVIKRLLLVNDRPGILVRSSSGDEIDRIVALDMGADDCVDESCSAREIGARAAAITRRLLVRPEARCRSGRFKFAGWELQADTRQLLTPTKNLIHLTGNEYSLISCLLSDPGSVKSRSDLRYYSVTSDDDDGDLRTMDVLVSRLRKKMMHYGDENIIETVRGFGYRLITR
jgi:two-component system OmpR family response regulator